MNKSMVANIINDREIVFLLEEVRVVLKASIPDMKVGSVALSASGEGSTLQLPRWVALEMEKMGFAEILEENLYNELLRTLSRERVQSSTSLSTLDKNLYQKIRQFHSSRIKRDEAIDLKASTMARDVVDLRLMKLLRLAVSPTSELSSRFTQEEASLIRFLSHSVEEWRSTLLATKG